MMNWDMDDVITIKHLLDIVQATAGQQQFTKIHNAAVNELLNWEPEAAEDPEEDE